MSFENITKGILFIYDNYKNDEELEELIDDIDGAESDNEIRTAIRQIISILEKRNKDDENIIIIKQYFKNFI